MDLICQIIISENTSQVLLNTSIALLTIFIPVAISLFETNRDSEFSSLDRAVILDHLVNGKRILWELGLLFIPVFFWSVESFTIRTIVFIMWSLGVYFAITKLKTVYSWIRGNRFHYRFEYLTGSHINKESEDLWRSVWQSKDINTQNENIFFGIFKDKINATFLKDDIFEVQVVLKLIQDFEILINKRDIVFLTAKDDVFSELLKWNYLAWERDFSNMGNQDDISKYMAYSTLYRVLNQIFKKILERSLEGHFPYGFFTLIEEHLKSHKENKIIKNNKDFYYIGSFLSTFYSSFFDLISSSKQSYDIWEHYFPKFLKIDEETLKDSFAKLTLQYYIPWAIERIRGVKEKEYDSDLEDVTREIFPNTDPIFWSIMMTLLMRSWGESGRMKSLIETPRKLGFVGRIFSWSGSIGEEPDTTAMLNVQQEQQVAYSINLLCKVFPHEFSLKTVKEYISELNSFGYPEDEKKELYRKQVLHYMELIKNYLEGLVVS
jgi:hypothetical protein